MVGYRIIMVKNIQERVRLMGKIDDYPIPKTCIYCNAPVIFTSNAEVYRGRTYGNGYCYKCTDCDAYVGVHTGTNIPKGRLANAELRTLKIQCHKLFDPVWKGSAKRISRGKAYERLAELLNIPNRECHFGWFDKKLLTKSLDILRNPKWYYDCSGTKYHCLSKGN